MVRNRGLPTLHSALVLAARMHITNGVHRRAACIHVNLRRALCRWVLWQNSEYMVQYGSMTAG